MNTTKYWNDFTAEEKEECFQFLDQKRIERMTEKIDEQKKMYDDYKSKKYQDESVIHTERYLKEQLDQITEENPLIFDRNSWADDEFNYLNYGKYDVHKLYPDFSMQLCEQIEKEWNKTFDTRHPGLLNRERKNAYLAYLERELIQVRRGELTDSNKYHSINRRKWHKGVMREEGIIDFIQLVKDDDERAVLRTDNGRRIYAEVQLRDFLRNYEQHADVLWQKESEEQARLAQRRYNNINFSYVPAAYLPWEYDSMPKEVREFYQNREKEAAKTPEERAADERRNTLLRLAKKIKDYHINFYLTIFVAASIVLISYLVYTNFGHGFTMRELDIFFIVLTVLAIIIPILLYRKNIKREVKIVSQYIKDYSFSIEEIEKHCNLFNRVIKKLNTK